MKLHEAIAVTYAAVGQDLTDAALQIITTDLRAYPLPAVFAALQRCRRELKRIALVDILDRIPGGHPGAEEAWSIVSKALTDEKVTVVWTDEISQAFGVALGLNDDPIAARMAFKEVYTKLIAEARDQRKPVVWRASLGHDPHGREPVLLESIEKGRLTSEHIAELLPYRDSPHPRVAALIAGAGVSLPVPKAAA